MESDDEAAASASVSVSAAATYGNRKQSIMFICFITLYDVTTARFSLVQHLAAHSIYYIERM